VPACAWEWSRTLVNDQSQHVQMMKEQIAQTVCHAGVHYQTQEEARDNYLLANAAASIREMQGGHVFAQPGENHTHRPQQNNTLNGSTSVGTTNAMLLHLCGSRTGYKLTTLQHLPSTGSENVSFAPSSPIATTHPRGLPFSPSPLITSNIKLIQYISPVSTACNLPRISNDSTDFKGATPSKSHEPMQSYAGLWHTHPDVHTKRRIQLERWANEIYDIDMTVCALVPHPGNNADHRCNFR
jgi:hypothetical protein